MHFKRDIGLCRLAASLAAAGVLVLAASCGGTDPRAARSSSASASPSPSISCRAHDRVRTGSDVLERAVHAPRRLRRRLPAAANSRPSRSRRTDNRVWTIKLRDGLDVPQRREGHGRLATSTPGTPAPGGRTRIDGNYFFDKIAGYADLNPTRRARRAPKAKKLDRSREEGRPDLRGHAHAALRQLQVDARLHGVLAAAERGLRGRREQQDRGRLRAGADRPGARSR